jgi:hypothetical protein
MLMLLIKDDNSTVFTTRIHPHPNKKNPPAGKQEDTFKHPTFNPKKYIYTIVA